MAVSSSGFDAKAQLGTVVTAMVTPFGADGSVGIWHETYKIEPGQAETLYGNMPMFGLGAATHHVPAVGRRETARRRLGDENEPAIASPQQSYPTA